MYRLGVVGAVQRIEAQLAEIGADARRVEPSAFMVRIPTERRGTIAVGLRVGERTLSGDAFFMRGPDRGHEGVYRRLLRRNLGPGRWRFALDDDGDLFLVLRVGLAGLSAADLDGLLGELSITVDESFDGVLELGFDISATGAGGGGRAAPERPQDSGAGSQPNRRASL